MKQIIISMDTEKVLDKNSTFIPDLKNKQTKPLSKLRVEQKRTSSAQ